MTSLRIRGGRVDADIRDGVIDEQLDQSTMVLDATGCHVVSGFVDGGIRRTAGNTRPNREIPGHP